MIIHSYSTQLGHDSHLLADDLRINKMTVFLIKPLLHMVTGYTTNDVNPVSGDAQIANFL